MASRRVPWLYRSFLVAAVILVVGVNWRTGSLSERVVRDTLLYIAVPLGLGLAHGRHIGWRIDRKAIRNTVLLSAFVLPFYLVGSTLPTIREFYPMWSTSPELGAFVPHAVQLFVLALATETYYRGLLCVGVREIGRKCVFISPIVYAMMHAGKPPIELALSGPTDVLFGAVDYNANSILPSTVAHGAGLVLLDWLVLHDPILPPELVLRWLSWLPLPL
jgi:hypothetical protein